MKHNSCAFIVNLNRIQSSIQRPNKVTLLVVSKYTTVEVIKTIFEQGINGFAYNFIQIEQWQI